MCGFLLVVIFLLLDFIPETDARKRGIEGIDNEEACYGSSLGMNIQGNVPFRYERYKQMYENCTYIVGNLEITFLEDFNGEDYDLSFLSSIREVTGYVLLVGNHVDYIPLTSLRIIRGTQLFLDQNTKEYYALYVALNYDKAGTRGLRELRFTNLTGG